MTPAQPELGLALCTSAQLHWCCGKRAHPPFEPAFRQGPGRSPAGGRQGVLGAEGAGLDGASRVLGLLAGGGFLAVLEGAGGRGVGPFCSRNKGGLATASDFSERQSRAVH